ncbi:hypothetical protein RHGRI_023932 [Rhododendron griersonianum]|uniref:Uncharacterized protein n=1 Tax=Rhododendron griersonianum TaxID=479676 RepID=A0AAV6J5Q0_9ERIC|nr:hypothetical protein RHGRI_023932 [Rhododendron griersonianum]
MTRKRKTTHMCNGEEDSQAQIGKELSKGTIAQRARRERERILKQSIARQSEQQLHGDTSVQPLRDSNIAVHVHEEIQRLEAIAKKGKAVYMDSGKENSQVLVVGVAVFRAATMVGQGLRFRFVTRCPLVVGGVYGSAGAHCSEVQRLMCGSPALGGYCSIVCPRMVAIDGGVWSPDQMVRWKLLGC